MLKCLSIQQPYASLIIGGVKRVETRQWTTSYRGPLLIHASSAIQGAPNNLHTKAIIGLVQLEEVFSHADLNSDGDLARIVSPRERKYGHFGPGWFAWWVLHARRFTQPIPHKGNLGLWEPNPSEQLDYELSRLGLSCHSTTH